MKKGIGYSIAALCGAVIGGVSVFLFERKRCDILIKEKEAAATEFYLQKLQEICYDELPEQPENNDQDAEHMLQVEPSPVSKQAYSMMSEALGYSGKSETPSVVVTEPEEIQGIYEVDDRDDFGNTGHESCLIDYYSDGVFVDSDYRVLTQNDIYAFFGNIPVAKLLTDEKHDGLLYIQNDKLEIDFEITEHPMTWSSMKATGVFDNG